MKTVVVTEIHDMVVAALVDDERILSISIGNDDDKIAIGSIYQGKVRDVRRPMGAAFVELSSGAVGYLNLNDPSVSEFEAAREHGLRPGDEFPVQVTKKGVGDKDPALTTSLTIPGRYVVATERPKSIQVSSRIKNKNLRTYLKEILSSAGFGCGFIIRTNGENASEEVILAEAQKLSITLENIRHYSCNRTAHSLLYAPDPEWTSMIRDLPEEEEASIVTDIPEYVAIAARHAREGVQVSLYDDKDISLSVIYRLENCLDKIRQRRVWLPSGAYIVIDRTEALVAIDVNFGKSTRKKDEEESSFQINCEAAREIAYQVRLRNLGGIIIVDFINMREEENYEKLRKVIEQACADDPSRMLFVSFTKLGLAEFTRKKTSLPLADQMKAF